MLRFVLLVIALGVVALGFRPVAGEEAIHFAYIGSQDHPALLGVKQGVSEANLQGKFLGQQYHLDIMSPEAAKQHDFSRYIAVLAAVDADYFIKLSKQQTNRPIFNLSLTDDTLRSACLNNVLHVIPSRRMQVDAEAQWQKKQAGSPAVAQAWHHTFVKFAARDLNKRFKKNHHTEMDDAAWAGWAAVKMSSDSIAREEIRGAKKMLDYLRLNLVFDGQKGEDLSFRDTGQLRQLMLLVENDEIVAEAPVRGVATDLDSLGLVSCN